MKQKQNIIDIEIKMLIDNQKASIRFYTIFTFILWIVGIGVVIFVYTNKAINNNFQIVLQTSAGLIGALSCVPLKEIISKREKVSAYRIVNRHIEEMNNSQEKVSDKEIQKMRELVWKIVENTTLA